ncbi:hypothetical protein DSM3645_15660 [Blastopirellula marina DSM 3645]|uniref:Uncharacterized protein n=2 Tax=Blastopirellula marina TaxID=124 RepID=A3ZZ46_9BACT|nr:hypothetical protein DSM3645_15660 [Blastopirellula marina DSM 3645]
MSLLQQPPGEEQEDWGPAPAERPVAAESLGSPFRFSLTRLIIATAMSPLPLLLIHRWNVKYAWCFILSCCTLFLTILWARAETLPRINMFAAFMLTAAAIFGPIGWPAFPVLVMFAVPSLLISQFFFPSQGMASYRPAKCIQVLLTASLPFCVFCVGGGGIANLASRRRAPEDWYIGWPILLVFAVLLGINIYWAVTDRGENLAQRPDLGYKYEATMVLIPFAIMVFVSRMLRGDNF